MAPYAVEVLHERRHGRDVPPPEVGLHEPHDVLDGVNVGGIPRPVVDGVYTNLLEPVR